MTIEIEHQIRNRISEIKLLLRNLTEDTASRYRYILNDEIIRLKKELAELTPLDNESYLADSTFTSEGSLIDDETVTNFELNELEKDPDLNK